MNPPAGFETEAELNRTLVDIVYRGQRVGASMARFNDAEITFEAPNQILNGLPGLRDPEAVLQGLSRPLPVNADRLCAAQRSGPVCGFIHTNEVAVIFDQGTLQAEIFINALYTYDRDPRANFLPAPTIAPGLISSVSTRAVYDFDGDRLVGNHRLRAIGGHGRFAMRGEAFATGDGSGEFSALYATHSGEDRAWSAGLIPPQSNGGLARSRRMFGVRFGTMLDTRLDQRVLRSTPLDVSITRAASVEIQRDGQTLDVQNLRAGDRTLDTSRLPAGSYTVDLIITEGGVERQETRFFSTSARLPPRGAARWYVELGNVVPLRRSRDGFEDSDPVALAVGWRQRLARNLGVWADGFFSNDTSFLEFGGLYLRDGVRAELSALASDRGSVGLSANSAVEISGWSINGRARFLNTVSVDEETEQETYTPFRRAFTEASLSLQRTHDWGRYGVRGYYRKSDNGSQSWFAGPFGDLTLIQAAKWRFSLNAQAEHSDNRQSAYLGLRLSRSLRSRSRTTRQIQVSGRVDTNLTRLKPGNTQSNNTVTEANAALDQRFGATARAQLDGGVRYEDQLGLFARGTYTAPWIGATLEGRRNYQNQSTALLNANTGLVIGGGRVSLHNTREESGLQAYLNSVRDVPVAIQVDQRTRRTVKAGHAAFVPLRSYAIHDVGIQPSTTEDLAYDQGTERFIVYPGNVMRLDRSVQPVVIVVGQLIDTDGTRLAGALLRTTETIGRTDQDGFFQIDVVIGQTVRATSPNGEICRFDVQPDIESDQAYANLGPVICN